MTERGWKKRKDNLDHDKAKRVKKYRIQTKYKTDKVKRYKLKERVKHNCHIRDLELS